MIADHQLHLNDITTTHLVVGEGERSVGLQRFQHVGEFLRPGLGRCCWAEREVREVTENKQFSN